MPKETPKQTLHLCPINRYLIVVTDRALRAYADADTLPEKESTLMAALDLARLIEATICPLAFDAGRDELAAAARVQSSRLLDLARPWIDKHPANFPPKPDHTLQILDILEGLERGIRTLRDDVDRLTKRREARAEAQPQAKARKEAA